MFVVAAAVPALLVVLLGYVAGYTVTALLGRLSESAFGAPLDPGTPEVVGWGTGLVLLGVVTWLAVARPPWLRRLLRRVVGGDAGGAGGSSDDGRAGRHQK